MLASERLTHPEAVATPPRSMAWVLLASAAVAVLIAGLAATVAVLATTDPRQPPLSFWLWMLATALLTIASLGLRTLRWIFLLRRSGTRIPIRDAYVAYFAGFSLLLVPLFIGEIAVRAFVHRSRAGVSRSTTCTVSLWERMLDASALAAIVATTGVVLAADGSWTLAALAVVVCGLIPAVRRVALSAVGFLSRLALGRKGPDSGLVADDCVDLARSRTWIAALATSIVAWMLPALGLWGLARASGAGLGVADAEGLYAWSTLDAGLQLAPGGIVLVGAKLMAALGAHGLSTSESALTVLAMRLMTVGVSTILGVIFVAIHLRSRAHGRSHFDALAAVYDAQIPEWRRNALLVKKTDLMQKVLTAHGTGTRGLDAGCGQGWYVARMAALGYHMRGIDTSAEQIGSARRKVDDADALVIGSVLDIPSADAEFDFAYCINVLHHLDSIEDQRAAFAELFRVIRPGGLLFVHEINTRNVLFRFYMGYVFPSLNCIDEGVERWLLPNRLSTYTSARVIHVEHFTFLPEFLPEGLTRRLGPIEAALEGSSLREYSGHYMATLQKPA